MRVALPHSVPHEELRRRFRARSPEIGSLLPPGMAQVTQTWHDDDHLEFNIAAMGQNIVGKVELLESEVVINLDLPSGLGFFEQMIESKMRERTQKLLA